VPEPQFISTVKNRYRAVVGRPLQLDVHRSSSPLVTLLLVNEDQSSFDLYLGGPQLHFIVKANTDTVDPSPWYSTGSGITIIDPVGGVVEIQFQSSDIPQVGSKFFRLDCTKGSQTTILVSGRLQVQNT
jgi:hypothetical protein